MKISTEKSSDWLTRDNDPPSVSQGLLLAGALYSQESVKHVRRCQCQWRKCAACRSHTAFQDVLLLLLLALVSVELNQKESVHLPLGSVLSVRRPGVGRVSPGWEVYVESVVWPCGGE